MKKATSTIISLIMTLVLTFGTFIPSHAESGLPFVTQADASTTLSVPQALSTTSQTILSTTLSIGSGMWISSVEIMSLPTSGTAWDKMRTAAYGSWGTADLQNDENRHAISVLAGALVFARTGDPSLRSKVRDAIIAAKRSLDEISEWQSTNGVLATGRQLGTYVISADLIDLKNYDSVTNAEFRLWLTAIRTTNIGIHGRWKAITYTCENAAGNWNTFACASRIAASIYLGDIADVDRASAVIRAFLGERAYYPANAPGRYGYFEHTAGYQASWSCAGVPWTGINPPCTSLGINIDGVLVEDASRGGGCCVLQGDGISYSWEALQGLFVSTELLYRTGRYGNPYTWSNQALKRALDFMQRSGWSISNAAKYVPWMANARYGTSYSTASSITGRLMGWGDWLYAIVNTSPVADIDGDGDTDIVVFRPSNGTWYVHEQGSFVYGTNGDIPVAADYDGDRKVDIAVFRPSNNTWYIRGQGEFVYGQSGDIPVVADYNGDGKADIAVFRPTNGTWYLYGIGPRVYGTVGDIPVVADYNGDGKADIAVFRPTNSTWYLYGIGSRVYGTGGDLPVVGDYNGDRKADIAIFRPSTGTWHVSSQTTVNYGMADDIPVPGDYDGDGDTDIAVFRKPTGTWHVSGQFVVNYGSSGDFPAAIQDTNGDGDPYD